MLKEEFLFEISWEVCNKVGGIHTVITSKINQIQKYFNHYFLIGPYLNYKDYSSEFNPIEVPFEFEKTTKELEKIGIKLHFGTWINQINQKVILIEYLNYSKNINDIKKILWDKYKIDSLGSNWYDFDEAILWSWCCGIVIEKLQCESESTTLVHAHEWMSGGAIFYLKQLSKNSKFKTIFTTHATMLGRTISSSDLSLYDNLENIDANSKSYELGIHTKHQSEKALANISDCFTTVSEITNREAKKFYGKKADVLLPNGFNIENPKDDKEIILEFKKSRKNINEFLENYSKGFQNLNLKESLVFYTSGRNEFKDKGVDIYIKALSLLNQKLKEEKYSKNIINLFLIPIGNFETSKTFKVNEGLGQGISQKFLSYDEQNSSKIVSEKNSLKETAIDGSTILPFSTHKIPIENQIIKAFIDSGLLNRSEDRVKVILLPFYLNKNDGILNKNYYDIINGLDLGIFPSLYEPWGYTPMESISYSVPTITSDLAGFGKYCEINFQKHRGVYIIKRENELDENNVIKELTKILHNYSYKTYEDIEKLKEDSNLLSLNFSWKKFIKNYLDAYYFALRK